MKLINLHRIVLCVSICLIEAVSFGQGLFIDKTSEYGLALDPHHISFIDYNNDGWVDIYNSGTLWKNNEGKSFSKVFEGGGDGIWADFDNDGYSDQRQIWARGIF